MSKIIVVNLGLRVLIKAPEHIHTSDIVNKLNCEIALDMPNARIVDIEPKPTSTKVISEWEE
jgi:hypothetical protein